MPALETLGKKNMPTAHLEHINIVVSDPRATAALYGVLFGWHIRWEGAAMDDGYTVHVGTDTHYVALYSAGRAHKSDVASHLRLGGLTHIAVTVEDWTVMERAVKAAGLTPESHYTRPENSGFYFQDTDGIEYEIVCYE